MRRRLFAIAIIAAVRAAGAQAPSRPPMENPTSLTATWRLIGTDTAIFAAMEIAIAEGGMAARETRHAGGSWFALNRGCPARPDCQFRGPALGGSSKGVVLLKLIPATPGGVGGEFQASQVAADTLLGTLSLRSGAEAFDRATIALVRVKP